MKWVLLLPVILLLWILSACGGGGRSSSGVSSSEIEQIYPRNLRWIPPNLYIDNTRLDPQTDLLGYEIYVNESGTFSNANSPITFVLAVDNASHTLVTSYNLVDLERSLSKGTTYWVSMRVVAVSGEKSVFSDSLSFSF
jgi:hypothetical protein